MRVECLFPTSPPANLKLARLLGFDWARKMSHIHIVPEIRLCDVPEIASQVKLKDYGTSYIKPCMVDLQSFSGGGRCTLLGHRLLASSWKRRRTHEGFCKDSVRNFANPVSFCKDALRMWPDIAGPDLTLPADEASRT